MRSSTTSGECADPKTANEKAFNIVFSVLIQETLHLQLAANMATAIGGTPNFTSSPLQSDTCYFPRNSIIPRIIDLRDTRKYNHVQVNLGALSHEPNPPTRSRASAMTIKTTTSASKRCWP